MDTKDKGTQAAPETPREGLNWSIKSSAKVDVGEMGTIPALEDYRAAQRINAGHAEFVKAANPEDYKAPPAISETIKLYSPDAAPAPPAPVNLRTNKAEEEPKEKDDPTIGVLERLTIQQRPLEQPEAFKPTEKTGEDTAQKEAQRLSEERHRLQAEQQAAAQKTLDERYVHTPDGKYYPRGDMKHLAFQDMGEKLKTKDADSYTAASMVLAAQAKGWDSIKVSGHPEFRSKVWLEAAARGIEVKGYQPTEAEKALLADRQTREAKNSIEHIERYPTIPSQTATEKSANRKVIDAVTESVLKAKVPNPETREALREKISRKLDIYEKHGGNTPTLKTYDSAARKTAQDRVPVQHSERTR